MTMKFATDTEVADWNTQIIHNPDGGNMFQGFELSRQKAGAGWTPRYVIGDNVAMTVLEKYVLGLGNLWYIPKGPGVNTVAELAAILDDLKTIARDSSVFAVKIEPEIVKTNESLKALHDLGLIPSPTVQPNVSTIVVDISPDLDTVMAGLNQKGRHAIKRAERDGVTARAVEVNDENCRLFFDLLSQTASGRFRIRSFDYLKEFWQRYAKSGNGQIFFAYVDGQIVAGAFAVVMGEKSTYKDGASVRERPAYGASHLLQWRVIEWAKSRGSKSHDLCGTPSAADIKDEHHPFYGLGRFKSSFNKEVTDYVGAFDLPVRALSYKLWHTVGERGVRRLSFQFKREDWY